MADTSSSSSAVALDASWSKTEFKVVKFSHGWTIENYSFYTTDVGKCLKSSAFSTDPKDEKQPKWHLELHPKGKKEESKDYLGLFLNLDEHNQATESVSAKYKLCILKANGEQTNVKGSEEANKFVQGNGWGFEKFIRRDFLLDPKNGLLPNDGLSIFCEVFMLVDKSDVAVHDNLRTLGAVPQFRLSEDFGALLEKGLLTDCVLSSGDKQFQVHKAVLACRSPVFAAMFTNDTEEKQTGRVNIPDISAPVLSQLLHFVYTGCEPKLLANEDMAGELLAAADKYQLDRLKAICEQQLSIGLNKDNVCDVLVLADLHNAEHLKSRAINYINLHAGEVVESEGWRTLVASNPELLKLVLKSKAPNTANQIPSKKRESQQRIKMGNFWFQQDPNDPQKWKIINHE